MRGFCIFVLVRVIVIDTNPPFRPTRNGKEFHFKIIWSARGPFLVFQSAAIVRSRMMIFVFNSFYLFCYAYQTKLQTSN